MHQPAEPLGERPSRCGVSIMTTQLIDHVRKVGRIFAQALRPVQPDRERDRILPWHDHALTDKAD